MRRYESHWMSNEDWYHLDEYGDWVVNDDAPQEAKDSYALDLQQCEEAEQERIARGSLD